MGDVGYKNGKCFRTIKRQWGGRPR